ncbi:MAG: peptide chain release factor 1 [Actinobacteria bacterium]|nr:MAG: peptide chain release factor 1 [Actinomycetota bacterium]
MFGKLADIGRRFDEVERQLNDASMTSDQNRLRDLGREHAELAPIVHAWREHESLTGDLNAAQEMLKESGGADSAFLRDEIAGYEDRLAKLEHELNELLVPKDPNDDRDVIVEIRSAAGGDEAALFARDLYEMYQQYAENHRWKTESLSTSPSDLGGFKEVTFAVKGKGAYSKMKYESGVHRVQRVPATESQGRIHTSTATVAVLPEAQDVDVQINPNDLKVDVYRSSGPGGQSVNTTDSAVRITHLPTGEVVACQEERSQLQNKERAMRILRARLLERAQREQHAKIAAERKSAVGTGDRSEKIRTYNFPQNRVTDHRIGMSVQKLPQVLEGDLDDLIDALAAQDRADRLGDGAGS